MKTTANGDKKEKNGASGTPANVEKERDRKKRSKTERGGETRRKEFRRDVILPKTATVCKNQGKNEKKTGEIGGVERVFARFS